MAPLYGMSCPLNFGMPPFWHFLTLTCDLLDWSLVVTMLNLGRTPVGPRYDPGEEEEAGRAGATGP